VWLWFPKKGGGFYPQKIKKRDSNLTLEEMARTPKPPPGFVPEKSDMPTFEEIVKKPKNHFTPEKPRLVPDD